MNRYFPNTNRFILRVKNRIQKQFIGKKGSGVESSNSSDSSLNSKWPWNKSGCARKNVHNKPFTREDTIKNKSRKEESCVKSSNSFSAFTMHALCFYIVCTIHNAAREQTQADRTITTHIWLMTSGSYDASWYPHDLNRRVQTRIANVIWLSRGSLDKSRETIARKDLNRTGETKHKDRAAITSLRISHRERSRIIWALFFIVLR